MPTQYLIGPETPRLLHRALTVEDAPTAFTLHHDPDVTRYTGDEPWASVEEAKTRIADHPDFKAVGFGRWACVLKETQVVVGTCGLKYLDDVDEVDIGYRFLPAYWGQGFATEAARACIDFGFQTIGLKRIVAYVLPENSASIHVIEKTGMIFEEEYDYDGLLALRYAKEV